MRMVTDVNVFMKLSRLVVAVIFIALPHATHGQESMWPPEIPQPTNAVWNVLIQDISITNATIEEACGRLEMVSRRADPTGRGIHIAIGGLNTISGVPKKIKSERISFEQRNRRVFELFYVLMTEIHFGQDWRIIDDVAIVGNRYDLLVCPVLLRVQCMDANTHKVIDGAKVINEAKTDYSLPWINEIKSTNGLKWVELSGRVVIPHLITDAQTTLVDSQIWNRVMRFKATADGYGDKTFELNIFGDLNVTSIHTIEMQRAGSMRAGSTGGVTHKR